jgi:hypothetical protein
MELRGPCTIGRRLFYTRHRTLVLLACAKMLLWHAGLHWAWLIIDLGQGGRRHLVRAKTSVAAVVRSVNFSGSRRDSEAGEVGSKQDQRTDDGDERAIYFCLLFLGFDDPLTPVEKTKSTHEELPILTFARCASPSRSPCTLCSLLVSRRTLLLAHRVDCCCAALLLQSAGKLTFPWLIVSVRSPPAIPGLSWPTS